MSSRTNQSKSSSDQSNVSSNEDGMSKFSDYQRSSSSFNSSEISRDTKNRDQMSSGIGTSISSSCNSNSNVNTNQYHHYHHHTNIQNISNVNSSLNTHNYHIKRTELLDELKSLLNSQSISIGNINTNKNPSCDQSNQHLSADSEISIKKHNQTNNVDKNLKVTSELATTSMKNLSSSCNGQNINTLPSFSNEYDVDNLVFKAIQLIKNLQKNQFKNDDENSIKDQQLSPFQLSSFNSNHIDLMRSTKIDQEMCISILAKTAMIVYVDDRLTSLLGYESNSWLGKPLINYLFKNDSNLFLTKLYELTHKITDDDSASSLIFNEQNLVDIEMEPFFLRFKKEKILTNEHQSYSTKALMVNNINGQTSELPLLITKHNSKEYVAFRVESKAAKIKLHNKEEPIESSNQVFSYNSNNEKNLETSIIFKLSFPSIAYFQEIDNFTERSFITKHDINLKIDRVENKITELLGFLPQDLEKKCLLKFIHHEDLEKLKQIHYDIYDGKERQNQEIYKWLCFNGSHVSVKTNWSCYIHPWKKQIDFIIGKHIVLNEPVNKNIFEENHPKVFDSISIASKESLNKKLETHNNNFMEKEIEICEKIKRVEREIIDYISKKMPGSDDVTKSLGKDVIKLIKEKNSCASYCHEQKYLNKERHQLINKHSNLNTYSKHKRQIYNYPTNYCQPTKYFENKLSNLFKSSDNDSPFCSNTELSKNSSDHSTDYRLKEQILSLSKDKIVKENANEIIKITRALSSNNPEEKSNNPISSNRLNETLYKFPKDLKELREKVNNYMIWQYVTNLPKDMDSYDSLLIEAKSDSNSQTLLPNTIIEIKNEPTIVATPTNISSIQPMQQSQSSSPISSSKNLKRRLDNIIENESNSVSNASQRDRFPQFESSLNKLDEFDLFKKTSGSHSSKSHSKIVLVDDDDEEEVLKSFRNDIKDDLLLESLHNDNNLTSGQPVLALKNTINNNSKNNIGGNIINNKINSNIEVPTIGVATTNNNFKANKNNNNKNNNKNDNCLLISLPSSSLSSPSINMIALDNNFSNDHDLQNSINNISNYSSQKELISNNDDQIKSKVPSQILIFPNLGDNIDASCSIPLLNSITQNLNRDFSNNISNKNSNYTNSTTAATSISTSNSSLINKSSINNNHENGNYAELTTQNLAKFTEEQEKLHNNEIWFRMDQRPIRYYISETPQNICAQAPNVFSRNEYEPPLKKKKILESNTKTVIIDKSELISKDIFKNRNNNTSSDSNDWISATETDLFNPNNGLYSCVNNQLMDCDNPQKYHEIFHKKIEMDLKNKNNSQKYELNNNIYTVTSTRNSSVNNLVINLTNVTNLTKLNTNNNTNSINNNNGISNNKISENEVTNCNSSNENSSSNNNKNEDDIINFWKKCMKQGTAITKRLKESENLLKHLNNFIKKNLVNENFQEDNENSPINEIQINFIRYKRELKKRLYIIGGLLGISFDVSINDEASSNCSSTKSELLDQCIKRIYLDLTSNSNNNSISPSLQQIQPPPPLNTNQNEYHYASSCTQSSTAFSKYFDPNSTELLEFIHNELKKKFMTEFLRFNKINGEFKLKHQSYNSSSSSIMRSSDNCDEEFIQTHNSNNNNNNNNIKNSNYNNKNNSHTSCNNANSNKYNINNNIRLRVNNKSPNDDYEFLGDDFDDSSTYLFDSPTTSFESNTNNSSNDKEKNIQSNVHKKNFDPSEKNKTSIRHKESSNESSNKSSSNNLDKCKSDNSSLNSNSTGELISPSNQTNSQNSNDILNSQSLNNFDKFFDKANTFHLSNTFNSVKETHATSASPTNNNSTSNSSNLSYDDQLCVKLMQNYVDLFKNKSKNSNNEALISDNLSFKNDKAEKNSEVKFGLNFTNDHEMKTSSNTLDVESSLKFQKSTDLP